MKNSWETKARGGHVLQSDASMGRGMVATNGVKPYRKELKRTDDENEYSPGIMHSLDWMVQCPPPSLPRSIPTAGSNTELPASPIDASPSLS